MGRRVTAREHVLARLIIDPSGCLLWTGRKNQMGYGTVRVGPRDSRKWRMVHRLMYEWFVGPVPEGLVIDHLCRIRHCASPAHLEAVTPGENVRRSWPFRTSPSRALKELCPRGHKYVPVARPDRHQVCRECRRIWEAGQPRRSHHKQTVT